MTGAEVMRRATTEELRVWRGSADNDVPIGGSRRVMQHIAWLDYDIKDARDNANRAIGVSERLNNQVAALSAERDRLAVELAELRKQHDDPADDLPGTVRCWDGGSVRIVVVRSAAVGGQVSDVWRRVSAADLGAKDVWYGDNEVRGWTITGVVPGSEADTANAEQ